MLLGETQLFALSNRPDILAAFPQFRGYRPLISSECGGCGGARRPDVHKRTMALSSMRLALIQMSPSDKERLKKMLGVSSIVIFSQGPHGVEKHTI